MKFSISRASWSKEVPTDFKKLEKVSKPNCFGDFRDIYYIDIENVEELIELAKHESYELIIDSEGTIEIHDDYIE